MVDNITDITCHYPSCARFYCLATEALGVNNLCTVVTQLCPKSYSSPLSLNCSVPLCHHATIEQNRKYSSNRLYELRSEVTVAVFYCLLCYMQLLLSFLVCSTAKYTVSQKTTLLWLAITSTCINRF